MDRTSREITETVHEVTGESKIREAQDADRAPGTEELYEILDDILYAADQLPEEVRFPFVLKSIRPWLQEFEPEERRGICDELAEIQPEHDGKETGRFFNALTRAQCPPEPDMKELGRRIMEKRNPHYRRKEN